LSSAAPDPAGRVRGGGAGEREPFLKPKNHQNTSFDRKNRVASLFLIGIFVDFCLSKVTVHRKSSNHGSCLLRFSLLDR
jgi:hypothetical protein